MFAQKDFEIDTVLNKPHMAHLGRNVKRESGDFPIWCIMTNKTFALLLAIFLISCFMGDFTSLYAIPTPFKHEDIMKDYAVIQKPSINVVGIECRTSNAPTDAPQDIPKLWQQFYREDIINKIPNKTSNDVIALYCDYEGDYTQPYSLVIGCPVTSLDNVPEGMIAKIIPAGSYALFRAVGEYPSSLIRTWGNIWQTELKRTYTGDYEFYEEKFFSETPKEVEVFIAIEK